MGEKLSAQTFCYLFVVIMPFYFNYNNNDLLIVYVVDSRGFDFFHLAITFSTVEPNLIAYISK
jgi:hypothetical protein